ncbi:SatD family protein [Microbacterium sp. YY-01]|uniref:SatD family protein n=1 Tax=Microbacterium sp. YY-01 TaxID=3421634 RepID=UPI003D1761F5
MIVAVIADIVGSRRLPDRAASQRVFEDTIAQVESDLATCGFQQPIEPLTATVGDEFQTVYATLEGALTATLLIQLALPEGHQLRFGVGVGGGTIVDTPDHPLHDGPAWWAARTAIDTTHRQAERAIPTTRIRVTAGNDQDAGMLEVIHHANAYLLVRDHLIAAMSNRERRLTYGRCLGHTQSTLAEAEGITQPGVSQALAVAGAAAIIEGLRPWKEKA